MSAHPGESILLLQLSLMKVLFYCSKKYKMGKACLQVVVCREMYILGKRMEAE